MKANEHKAFRAVFCCLLSMSMPCLWYERPRRPESVERERYAAIGLIQPFTAFSKKPVKDLIFLSENEVSLVLIDKGSGDYFRSLLSMLS